MSCTSSRSTVAKTTDDPILSINILLFVSVLYFRLYFVLHSFLTLPYICIVYPDLKPVNSWGFTTEKHPESDCTTIDWVATSGVYKGVSGDRIPSRWLWSGSFFKFKHLCIFWIDSNRTRCCLLLNILLLK